MRRPVILNYGQISERDDLGPPVVESSYMIKLATVAENSACVLLRTARVECLIGKQKKPILFKVTEPSSIPYRTPPACAKWRRTVSGQKYSVDLDFGRRVQGVYNNH